MTRQWKAVLSAANSSGVPSALNLVQWQPLEQTVAIAQQETIIWCFDAKAPVARRASNPEGIDFRVPNVMSRDER